MWGDGMSSIIITIIMCNGFLISFVLIISSIIEIKQWCKKRSNKNKIREVNDSKPDAQSLEENINVIEIENK
jgi:hypothetical protein